jgi:hypothetical protein
MFLSFSVLFLVNLSVDFREIWKAGAAIQGDLDVKLFNLVASAIPKWLTFKLLRWV